MFNEICINEEMLPIYIYIYIYIYIFITFYCHCHRNIFLITRRRFQVCVDSNDVLMETVKLHHKLTSIRVLTFSYLQYIYIYIYIYICVCVCVCARACVCARMWDWLVCMCIRYTVLHLIINPFYPPFICLKMKPYYISVSAYLRFYSFMSIQADEKSLLTL